MTIRTDIHRPSAIVTADYDFIACMTNRDDAAIGLYTDRALLMGFMQRTGATYARHEHGGTCMVCGAAALDYAVFHHIPTNTLVCMGMDCASKTEMGVDGQFRSFKKRIADGLALKAGKAKARAQLVEHGLDAAWSIYEAQVEGFQPREDFTIRDMVAKLVRYGSMSDKQWAFMASLVARVAARPAVEAAREAEKAVKRATSAHVGSVGERRVFALTIVATPTYESQFGTMTINICDDADGNVVVYKGKRLGAKGETVRVKATVKSHDTREGVAQTIINRPAEEK